MEHGNEKKPVKRSRGIALTFRVSAEEHEMIKRRMAQAGIKNLRAFILKQAVDGRVIHVELRSVNEMCRLLSNATNNINQIARRVNETGSVYAADVSDLNARYEEIWTQTREILKKLAAL
ncbi:MAG: MobC family plasmid mobilization relaxosome protein [Clostridiales bacterium]|nr:MobC family plasmid mobilization relaxosome protein [Clostridiales bacterium]